MSDPWIRPAAADKIEALFPKAQRVNVNAGHCPHDEAPVAVNAALKAFVQSCN
jgi:pimeloyl-ACP methyl ester carboxylesterase